MPSLIPETLDAPRTHVLVIGVSAYRHFEDGSEPTQRGELLGMRQLSAAARSGSEFAAWMLNEYAAAGRSIGSLRVLLSPSSGEQVHPDIAALGALPPATLANVVAELGEFRAACDTFGDNVAVVYIAGHGVQLTKTGATVLLHDCGGPAHLNLLDAAIDVPGVHAGFDHDGTAQTQFWFVDSCRQRPAIARRFEELVGGLRLDRPLGTANATPLFLAASTGEAAFARVGGLSLFSEALLSGLRGGIAQTDPDLSAEWHVSALELVKRLKGRVQALAEAEGVEQSVDPAGRLNEALFHEYPNAPDADVMVSLLPGDATQGSVGSLRHGQRGKVLDNVTQWPLRGRVESGLYELAIQAAPGFQDFSDFIAVRPPATREEVELSP